MPTSKVQRGELYWIDWNPARGSEQAGHRPGVIIQSDIPNKIERYPLTIVAALTTSLKGHRSNVRVEPSAINGLSSTSEVLCNQLQTISKDRVGDYIGKLASEDMDEVNEKLRYMLGLGT